MQVAIIRAAGGWPTHPGVASQHPRASASSSFNPARLIALGPRSTRLGSTRLDSTRPTCSGAARAEREAAERSHAASPPNCMLWRRSRPPVGPASVQTKMQSRQELGLLRVFGSKKVPARRAGIEASRALLPWLSRQRVTKRSTSHWCGDGAKCRQSNSAEATSSFDLAGRTR